MKREPTNLLDELTDVSDLPVWGQVLMLVAYAAVVLLALKVVIKSILRSFCSRPFLKSCPSSPGLNRSCQTLSKSAILPSVTLKALPS